MKTFKIVVSVFVLLALFWIWPNFVHEPMHLLGLKVQGIEGQMHLDPGYPPSPYTTRLGPIPNVAGGLLFVLAPSILSIIILAIVWFTRRAPTLFFHVVLPVYLCSDLILNIIGYRAPTNDFHFLVAFNSLVPIILISIIALICVTTINLNVHTLHLHHVSAQKNQQASRNNHS